MIIHPLSIYTSMKPYLLLISTISAYTPLFSFNYLVVIIVHIAFESTAINLIKDQKHQRKSMS